MRFPSCPEPRLELRVSKVEVTGNQLLQQLARSDRVVYERLLTIRNVKRLHKSACECFDAVSSGLKAARPQL